MLSEPNLECHSHTRWVSLRRINSIFHRAVIDLGCRSYVMTVLALVALAVQMSAQTADESQVKAAYLYNFAKFVDWPPASFQNANDPVVICILGEQYTSDVLKHSIQGKKANGRPIQVHDPHSREEFRSCHILFISFPEKERIAGALHELRGLSILTVGQSEDFIPSGGMVNMARHGRNIELEIDPEIPVLVGLKVSSRLLVVARIVKIKGAIEVER